MHIADLKVEVNSLIETLVTDGERKQLTKLSEALSELREYVDDSLAELGEDMDDSYVDDEDRPTLPGDEFDDGDFGDDLGDGVNDE